MQKLQAAVCPPARAPKPTETFRWSVKVDRVGFLGFAEIGCAGVLDRDDQVWIAGRLVGTVLGFDSCHFPNHYNILVKTPAPCTGPDLDLKPESRVTFGS